MKQGPFKNYGFTYEYEGVAFVFHIVASSEEGARGRAQAMAGAKFEGELKPVSVEVSEKKLPCGQLEEPR